MKVTKTWEAKIFVGLRAGYSDKLYDISKLLGVCQGYCNEIGWCVTVTPTTFIYKNGNEEGAIVGIIDYPRFPSNKDELTKRCIELAKMMMKATEQLRVTVVFPDDTVLLEAESEVNG
jgi:hypothetical protein